MFKKDLTIPVILGTTKLYIFKKQTGKLLHKEMAIIYKGMVQLPSEHLLNDLQFYIERSIMITK